MYDDRCADSDMALDDRGAIQHHLQTTDDPVVPLDNLEFASKFEDGLAPRVEDLPDLAAPLHRVLTPQFLSTCRIERHVKPRTFAESFHRIQGLTRKAIGGRSKESTCSQTHEQQNSGECHGRLE